MKLTGNAVWEETLGDPDPGGKWKLYRDRHRMAERPDGVIVRLYKMIYKVIDYPCRSGQSSVYQPSKQIYSTEDAVSIALHTALAHLEQPDTYARMLFVVFSSAFDIVIPNKLVPKRTNLGLSNALGSWIMSFLTNRPQNVRMGNLTSDTVTMNAGTPQECVLSPALFIVFTQDCIPIHPSFNTMVEFSDDTTVVGLNNSKTWYRKDPTSGVVVFRQYHQNQGDHYRLQEDQENHPAPTLH